MTAVAQARQAENHEGRSAQRFTSAKRDSFLDGVRLWREALGEDLLWLGLPGKDKKLHCLEHVSVPGCEPMGWSESEELFESYTELLPPGCQEGRNRQLFVLRDVLCVVFGDAVAPQFAVGIARDTDAELVDQLFGFPETSYVSG